MAAGTSNIKFPSGKQVSFSVKAFSFYLPVLITFLCAVSVLLITFYDYNTIKLWLDNLAADGSVDVLSEQRFNSIKSLAIIFIMFVGTICAIAVLFRGRISIYLTEFENSLKDDFARELHELRANLKSTPVIDYLLLAILAAIGLIVRLRFMNLPIRYDEAYSFLNYVSRPLIITLSLYDAPNNHILYNLCAKTAVLLFGSDEWVLRLPALIAGMLLIPGVYVLGRGIFASRSSGIMAAALVTGSAYLIEYSINARGYSFTSLFTIFILIATLQLTRSRSRYFWWTVFLIAAVAGMATIPIMIYPLAMSSVWLLLSTARSGLQSLWVSIKELLVVVAAIVLLTLLWYSPALITGGYDTFVHHGLAQRNFPLWLENLRYLYISFATASNGYLPNWATTVTVVAFVIGIVRRPLLVCSVLVIPVLFFIQNVVPYLHTRAFLFLTMLYLLFAAGGLVLVLEKITFAVSRKRRFISVMVVSFAIAGIQSAGWLRNDAPPNLDRTYFFPEAEYVITILDSKLSEKTPILTDVPLDNPLIYYGLKHGVPRMSFLSQGMVKLCYDSLWVVEHEGIGKCLLPAMIKANGLDTLYSESPHLETDLGLINVYLFSNGR